MALGLNDLLKVVTVMQWLDGDIMQNVFNVEIQGGTPPFDEQDVVDDMVDYADAMYAHLFDRISDQVDGSEVRVYIWDEVGDDWDEVGSAPWTFDPENVNEHLPRGVAGLINAKTVDPDVNGKKYLGGSTEAGNADGLWTVSEIAGLADFAAEWVAPFVGATSAAEFTPGIWSLKNLTFYIMTGAVIIPTIPAYQRRRKQGVGI